MLVFAIWCAGVFGFFAIGAGIADFLDRRDAK